MSPRAGERRVVPEYQGTRVAHLLLRAFIGAIADEVDSCWFTVKQDNPHGARVLLRARTLLARGASILVFPEGTTTRGHDVLPFKRGMFGLARKLALPVVPVTLDYPDDRVAWVGDSSFLPHYLAISGHPQVGARLEFGEPMFAGRGERAEQFAARVRECLRSRLRRDRAHAA